ncbi:MAG: ATP-binding cassette domain-containing protein, partial [Alphaproteobacteria bacterium]
NKLRIGYFSQHQTEELDMSDTPVSAMMRVMKKPETDVRGVLGRFGFSKPLSDNTISSLSGGEKARLLFAMIAHNAPHMLLLDEPTNHLDMDTREALVQALNAYEGAVVIVSHDPSMIERVADRLWLVADGAVHPFDGDLEAYRQHIIEQRRTERRGNKGEKTGPSKKELKAALNEKKKQHPTLWDAAERTEKKVAQLTRQKNQLEDDMTADDADVQSLQISYGKLVRELETAEEQWMEAQSAFDNA